MQSITVQLDKIAKVRIGTAPNTVHAHKKVVGISRLGSACYGRRRGCWNTGRRTRLVTSVIGGYRRRSRSRIKWWSGRLNLQMTVLPDRPGKIVIAGACLHEAIAFVVVGRRHSGLLADCQLRSHDLVWAI